jgi:hypothetical protein
MIFVIPEPDEVTSYAKSIGFVLDGNLFCDHYEARGWKYNGGVKMVNWKAAVRTWKHHGLNKQQFHAAVGGVKKTKLYPITGRSCGKCKMPAVYKDGSGGYDSYYCADHMPEKIKAKFC